ncbi:hypothetical protein BDQ17DRAFT_1484571 [Cyathus striatus]|nr:hypothetical protein BDQ17DRAFT_1484571 [Cyathus striatus]
MELLINTLSMYLGFVHPNMIAPDDENWKVGWIRLKTMYWALVAPELVLMWAYRQSLGAKHILSEHKDLHPDWTLKHAHFLQMGGFRICDGEDTKVLYPGQFHDLLGKGKISLPNVTEADIEDKRKADPLSKMIAVSQTLWFFAQCMGRLAQQIVLTQLEVATLAIVSCTFLLCFIWWDKPFDVRQPIYLEYNMVIAKENDVKSLAREDTDVKENDVSTVTITPHSDAE